MVKQALDVEIGWLYVCLREQGYKSSPESAYSRGPVASTAHYIPLSFGRWFNSWATRSDNFFFLRLEWSGIVGTF